MKLTEKMVDALCIKWKYPEKIEDEKLVEVKNEEGEVVDSHVDRVFVDNPQTKEEFVQEYTDNFVENEYRLQHRQDKKNVSEKEADEEVEEEVKKAK